VVEAVREHVLLRVRQVVVEDAEIELLFGQVDLENRVEPVQGAPQREAFDAVPAAALDVTA